MNLTKDAIVSTALRIMDTFGMADLSMRRIASSLDVQVSALYWHIASKQALLAAMADHVLRDLPPVASHDLTGIRLWAARFHQLLGRYNGSAEVVASVIAITGWDQSPAAPVATALQRLGFNAATARSAADGLVLIILGHSFREDEWRRAATLNVVSSKEPSPLSLTALDDMVELFIDGLAAREGA